MVHLSCIQHDYFNVGFYHRCGCCKCTRFFSKGREHSADIFMVLENPSYFFDLRKRLRCFRYRELLMCSIFEFANGDKMLTIIMFFWTMLHFSLIDTNISHLSFYCTKRQRKLHEHGQEDSLFYQPL